MTVKSKCTSKETTFFTYILVQHQLYNRFTFLSLFHIIKVLGNSKVFVNHFFFQSKFPYTPRLDGKNIVGPAISAFFCHDCFLLYVFQNFWVTFSVSLKLLFQFFTQFFFLRQFLKNGFSVLLHYKIKFINPFTPRVS